MTQGPDHHDAHLMDDDPTDTAPCPRCGKQLWAYAQRCHHCGVHLSGEAWQFDTFNPPTNTLNAAIKWLIVAAVIAGLVSYLWL